MRVKVNVANLPEPLFPAPRKVVIRKEKVVPTMAEKHRQRRWNRGREQVLLDILREGKNHREIAEEMGVSESAIHKKVQRLRKEGRLCGVE